MVFLFTTEMYKTIFKVQGRLQPTVKIVPGNARAQTEIVEELSLVDLFSLHTMKLGKIGNLCNRHSGFAKWRVQCFYDSLVQGSSLVFQMNICAESPPLPITESVMCNPKEQFCSDTTFVTNEKK